MCGSDYTLKKDRIDRPYICTMFSVCSESQASREECRIENLFSYFLTKTYVVCAKKIASARQFF